MSLISRKLQPGDGVIEVQHTHSTTSTGSSNGNHAQKVRGRAALAELAFSYPLKLMAPRISASDGSLAPGVLPVYMLTYGGGLVAGDTIDLKVRIEPACHLVLLTQGNTKVFRDRPGGSYLPAGTEKSKSRTHQRMDVTIASGASLFLLPAPVTCFERASYSQHQSFHLADPATSALLLLDWFTAGRLSRGETWLFERYRTANVIDVAGKRVANDVLLLEGEGFGRRMAGYTCYCTLFIYGDALAPVAAHFKKLTKDLMQYKLHKAPEDLIWSFSELEQTACAGIVRCAGRETETVREWLEEQLLPMRALIGSDVFRAAFV